MSAALQIAGVARAPKTTRGEKTLRRLLDAAAEEFGSRGFHQASITSITQRAVVAQGTFYTYFDSKEALFRALVNDLGEVVRAWVTERLWPAPNFLSSEGQRVQLFIEFVRSHKNLYNIILEAHLVAPDVYRAYSTGFANAYLERLDAAVANGEITPGNNWDRAWALVGISASLGLQYGIWDEERSTADAARSILDMVENGLKTSSGHA